MSRKKVLTIVIAVLICMVAAITLTGCIKENNAANVKGAQNAVFTATDELVIAQITDTHYYPLNYCYNGDAAGTDYESNLITAMKLLIESSPMIVQALEDIVEQKPDYLFVSGDLTHDGEIQAHIEMANLLRNVQNRIRAAGKPDFQIFVVPGNHDIYNPAGAHYRDEGKKTGLSHETTRKDMTIIYSSLGFPDLTSQEIAEYYAGLDNVYYDYLPYSGEFVNSTTAENIEIEYLYTELDSQGAVRADYNNGEITYIAYMPNDYVFICVDEEISNAVVKHHTGGLFYDNSREFINERYTDGSFEGKTLVGMMHHNAVPHFASEDTLLKDFTIYGWKETTDFFADIGIRFIFTGHMHSNDIATHTSFNGNVITDIETASAIGYKGAVRYCKLERGSLGGDYAENFSTRLALVNPTDFSILFDDGFLSKYYMEYCKLDQFISHTGGRYICTDPSEYAVTKLFYNIVENVKHEFLQPSFIAELGSFVSEMLPSTSNTLLNNLLAYAEPLINNIIRHIEEVVLKDYTYNGDTAAYKTSERGAKICGYMEDLVNDLLEMPVNSQGDTLFDFGLGGYLKHVGGTDSPYDALTEGEKEALDNLKNGTTVKAMLDKLLNKQNGLYGLILGLTRPIDLTYGMSATNADGLLALLRMYDPNVMGNAVDLNKLVSMITGLLGNLGFSIDVEEGATIENILDNLLNSYITGSFYTSLGEIAHDILFEFSVDETQGFEGSFNGDYVLYKYDANMAVSWLSTGEREKPSIENGKLPSMLTVTFGAEPKTDKNFVWFTDRRVDSTDIQYMEGEFDAAKATKKSGEYKLYATTTGNIDLGVFATLMHIEIGYHSVALKGLKPGTTYSYRVGSAAFDFWSEVYTFTTAPEDNAAFELLLLTDLQGSALSTYEQTAEVMGSVGKVFKNGYDFVINCGDVVDNSRNLVQWEYFLNSMQGYWGNTTQVAVTGNHDKYAYEQVKEGKVEYSLSLPDAINDTYNYFLLHYKLDYPAQDDTTGAFYSFDYSGVHFTVLNTNDLNNKNAMSDAQINWLTKDLQNTDKATKVVLMHKGLYTAGSHSKDADVIAMRAQLTPIFADNGVCLVLQGHDHTYSETYYLDRTGAPVKSSSLNKNKIGDEGVLYVTLGTMGDKFYNYVENENVPVSYGKKLHDPALSNPTFGKLVYDGENLYYYGYEYDLKTGKINKLNGMEWWHYAIIAAAAVLVVGAVTALVLSVKRKKAKFHS